MGKRKVPTLAPHCQTCGVWIRQMLDEHGELIVIEREPVDDGEYLLQLSSADQPYAKRVVAPGGSSHRDPLDIRSYYREHQCSGAS